MTFRLVPFEPSHVRLFDNVAGQERVFAGTTDDELVLLQKSGPGWTAFNDDEVLGCAGFVNANRFRAQAWALLRRTRPEEFIFVHRSVKNALAEADYRRIETYVNPLHMAAIRWIKMLGFTMERAYIPFFFPNGGGASEWVLYP